MSANLTMKRITQQMQAQFSVQMIYHIGVQRLEHKHFLVDISNTFQMDKYKSSLMKIFLVYLLNYISIIMFKILKIENFSC